VTIDTRTIETPASAKSMEYQNSEAELIKGSAYVHRVMS
jgi:hypothetical protein